MISSSFFPEVDGAVRVVYDLCRKLVRRGHDVYLLTRRLRGTGEYEDFEGIKVVRVAPSRTSVMNRLLLSLNSAIKLVEVLRRKEFDVIHAHGCVPALVGLVGRILQRVPLVVTFHGHQVLWPESIRWKGKMVLKLQLGLEKAILGRTDILVAQSTRIRSLFVKLYGSRIQKKIRIIPNGVDIDKFCMKTSGKTEPKTSSPQILAVGTLSRRKGFDILIKAMEIISRMEPKVRLIIVGEGPQKLALSELAKRLGVEDKVVFLNHLSDEELHKYYRISNVVALPTRAEFFPLVPLEAMTVAKPVISTKVIGPIDMIIDGENGILVEPNNAKELAEETTQLIKDRQLAKKIGMKGREIVKEKYSLDKIVDSYERTYFLMRAHK